MDNEALQRIERLERMVESLKSSSTIPLEVGRAFSERLKNNSLSASVKSASSENQSVNEAGASTYSVLGTPDGFDERIDGSLTKYYPFWL